MQPSVFGLHVATVLRHELQLHGRHGQGNQVQLLCQEMLDPAFRCRRSPLQRWGLLRSCRHRQCAGDE